MPASSRDKGTPLIRTMTEQVADALRNRIRDEKLAPGDRLGREEDLAREFGVSRPTMREALRLVSQGGLLRSTKGPGGGTFVRRDAVDTLSHSLAQDIATMLDVRAVTLDELLNARIALELPIVRLAAARIDDATVAELREMVTEFDERTADNETRDVANTRFHRAIARASANPILQASIDWAFEVLQPRQYEAMPPDQVEHPHSRIVDALAERDADAAAAAMGIHLGSVGEIVERKSDGQTANAGLAKVNADNGTTETARPGAATRVALQLQGYIQREGFVPGDRLGREDELAQLLGASRAALREALQMLTARNRVRVSRGPGGGIFLAHTFEDGMGMSVSRSVKELLDAKLVTVAQTFEARIAIEPGLAGLAALAAGPDDVAALSAEIDEQARRLDDGSADPGDRVRFHRLIASIAPNQVVSGITAWMFDAFDPELERLYGSDVSLKLTLEQDRRICEAIAAADPAAAEQGMRDHLEYFAGIALATER